MAKIKWIVQSYWLLLVFLIGKMILQFVVVNPVYELHRDEFLYLDQAKHLAAGYISVPPLTAWLSALVFALGGGEFWVRFFPALFGAFTILLAWLTIEEIGGRIYAKVLVSCALLFSVFVRLNILYQPNAFDILAWTAAFYFLVSYIRSQKPLWLYCLMLTFVLGIYNKYTMVFLLAALLTGLLLTPQRKILFSKNFFFGLLLGSVLLLPNVLWQISNDFPVLHHMAALKRTQLDYTSTSGFLIEQLMFISGSLVLIIAAFWALITYQPFKVYRVVGYTYVAVMLIFIALKAKSYYAFSIYPVLLVFGGVYLEAVIAKAWKKVIIGLLIVVNLLVFMAIYNLVFPVWAPAKIMDHKDKFEDLGLLKWNDGKNHHLPQDFADMLGWKEMAQKALAAYRMIPENERQQTLIFCDNYGQAGAINYYNRGLMPEAYSFNTDYIYWIPRMKEIKNVLMVGEKPEEEVTALFTSVQQTGKVENEFAIEKNTPIYLLKGAHPDITVLFYEEMDQRMATFDIF
ncbi:MAG TPA: glycosyltransferase family 39 protein [Prolixibacteraceae bacterium]|nr:glycosyltransferase family 39 protein [Prolixibacteraceae bacterium]